MFKKLFYHILFVINICFCFSCQNQVEFVCNDKEHNCVDCQGLQPQQYSFKDENGEEMQNCTRYICKLSDNNSYQLQLEEIEGASCDLDGDAGTLHGVCKLVDQKIKCIDQGPQK